MKIPVAAGARKSPPAGKGLVPVIGPREYFNPFRGLGVPTADTSAIQASPDEVAFVLFTGGEDVWPKLYGEPIGEHTRCDPSRDRYEKDLFEAARAAGIPCVGICRGSQFLCVMNGGKLAQDITGHGIGGLHDMQTHDDRVIKVTSTHHQMQLPPQDAIVLSHSHQRLSRHYHNGWNAAVEPHPEYEYEGVYYPAGRSLGMQWHPEYMPEGSDGFQYARQLVVEYILK